MVFTRNFEGKVIASNTASRSFGRVQRMTGCGKPISSGAEVTFVMSHTELNGN